MKLIIYDNQNFYILNNLTPPQHFSEYLVYNFELNAYTNSWTLLNENIINVYPSDPPEIDSVRNL